MKPKVMDLIPESMKEDLIQEVAEILKERAEKEANKPPSKEEIQEVVNNLM